MSAPAPSQKKKPKSLDETIRAKGYVIVQRPQHGEAVWRDGKGKLFLQSQVVKREKL